MAGTERAQIIPFPDPGDLSHHTFRRHALKEDLNKRFHAALHAIPNLEILGVDHPSHAITAPFFANKQSVRADTCYARVSTNLPTEAIPGIHELKVVGGRSLDFMMFELHEPSVEKRNLNPRELKRISERRLAALTDFEALNLESPDPFKILEIVTKLSLQPDALHTAQYMRWRIATRGEDALHPPKFPTLEIFFRGEHTFVILDQFPFPPTERTYRAKTIETFAGSKGESLIASIMKSFISGTPEDVHLALEIGVDFEAAVRMEPDFIDL